MKVRFVQLWRHLGAAKVPPLRIAILLSLLLHGALLVEWHLRPPPDTKPESKWGDTPGQFTVQLAPLPAIPSPPPSTPAPAAIAAQPAAESKPPPRPAPKAPAKPSRAAPPPVIALNKPGPADSTPAPAASAAPAATPQNDLSAMIEARRRARAASPSSAPAADASPTPAEDDIARSDRIIAANLGARTEAFGFDPRNGGGVFQIGSFNPDYADFKFYGWRQDIRRRAAQVFEVRKGNNADIGIAVVRKMIAIIREHETGKFSWQSQRLGHALILSAAPADNAGLEEFLMAEFFAGGQVRR